MSEPGEPLSERELDVLRRLAVGESNKAIADGLSISPLTVKTHLRNIYTKLAVSTRTEALNVALQQRLVTVVAADGQAAEDLPAEPPAVAPTLMPDQDGSTALASPAPIPPAPITGSGSSAVTGHRWRVISLALLVLLLLTAGAFAFVQWQGGALLPAGAEATPFVEQPLGDSRWLSSRPLPAARAGRAVVALGLDIYAIGGETDGGISDEVNVFDTQSLAWRRAATKPTAVAAATAAELFGEIYVPGGRLANGQPTAVVEVYSPSQDAWRRAAPLPQPIAGGLALADGGFLYLIGGQGEGDTLPNVYLYDPVGDSWRPVAALPEPRSEAAGGALTGQLYVVGGSDGAAGQPSCFSYDPPRDAWSDCPDMLLPRVNAGSTVLLNKLYVIGGTAGDAAYGEVYDPNTRTWTVLNAPPDVFDWRAPGVTHVETRIYAVGGRRGAALSDATLVYSPLTYQTYIPAAPSDRDE
ncbi:MAG TPA: kelch repeat-containing protein [Promineifilum sp.]|nr:kelch repeat-containing protein [Promineifilum sp.]